MSQGQDPEGCNQVRARYHFEESPIGTIDRKLKHALVAIRLDPNLHIIGSGRIDRDGIGHKVEHLCGLE